MYKLNIICTYEGNFIDKDDVESSDSVYIWENCDDDAPLYLDGNPQTSYGPLANDPLDDHRCNAKIVQLGQSREVVLIPTCDISKGDVIFLSDGAEY